MGLPRKFLSAPAATKQTVLAAAVGVVLIRLGLWVLPFPRLLRLVDRLSRPGTPGVHKDSTTQEVAWAVSRVSRRVPVATCLTQALTLNMLLSRRGEPSEIKIGIARMGTSGLKSHAWVVQDGQVIIGDNGELGVYSTLVSLDGAGNLLG